MQRANMFLEFITVLFSLYIKIKKKNKVLIYRKKVNLMNLGFMLILFSLYLKLNRVSFNTNTRHYKIKFILILFYIIFLLKIKHNYFIFFTNLFAKVLVVKKTFSKLFCLNKKVLFSCLFLKRKSIKYLNFYRRVRLKCSLFFIKYSISLLKLIDFGFFRLYRKFYFIKLKKRRKNYKLKCTITRYCRNILNFKKFKQSKMLLSIKKCILFLKKNILYFFKYRLPIYLSKLSSSYTAFLKRFLKKGGLFVTGATRGTINSLLSKTTLFNFLKISDSLDFFYKNYYYNIYLKKIKYNFYITVTNRKGDVIFSNSSGKVGLLKKKQKKSMFAINLVVRPAIKALLQLNILSIKNFFCPIRLKRIFLNVKYSFLRSGVAIEHIIIFNNKPHNFYYKKLKKQRRI